MLSFRYAPEAAELLGYGRSLAADETPKIGAAAVTPLYLAGALRAVRGELARRPYDLLQCHWVIPNGLVGATVAGRVPLAVGLHGSDVFMAEKAWVRPAVRWALRRTRALTGCSPELVGRICTLGFPPQRSEVIPYGVDSQKFSPDSGRSSIWRQKLGIPATAPVLYSIGRMATKKGYQVLIECLEELYYRHPDLHIVLAGAGDRLAEFRRDSEPWRERFHLPGAVLRDTLPDLYRAADIFVLPAIHDPQGNVDGLPNVLLEAMASSLPVVSTNISGIPLAIDDGVEGYLVQEQDPAALLDALDRTLSDPERGRAMGAAGRARVERDLTWDAVGARYRGAYERAMAG